MSRKIQPHNEPDSISGTIRRAHSTPDPDAIPPADPTPTPDDDPLPAHAPVQEPRQPEPPVRAA